LTNSFIGKSAVDHYVETVRAYEEATYKPNEKKEELLEPVCKIIVDGNHCAEENQSRQLESI